jgi:hypothetical protein
LQEPCCPWRWSARLPIQELETGQGARLFSAGRERKSACGADRSRSNSAATSASARWECSEPGFEILGPIPDQRAHFDEKRAAILQTPSPKRRHANVEPIGNFVFCHQVGHHATSERDRQARRAAGPLNTKGLPAGRTRAKSSRSNPRTISSSDLDFSLVGRGFAFIDADLLSHLLRQWDGLIGTPNLQISRFATDCNSL